MHATPVTGRTPFAASSPRRASPAFSCLFVALRYRAFARSFVTEYFKWQDISWAAHWYLGAIVNERPNSLDASVTPSATTMASCIVLHDALKPFVN